LPPDEFPDEMRSAQAAFRPSGQPAPPPPTPGQGSGRGSNIMGTWARYPKLAKAHLTLSNHLLWNSSLSDRQRELLILRVGRLCRCEYEWGQHVRMGAAAGLTADEIRRIAIGPDAPGWEGLDLAMLRAVDELIGEFVVSDQTWEDLSRELDVHQLMDLVFTVGQYMKLAMAMRSFGVEPDEELLPFLPDATGAWD
jgi:alkylhydroperoxidase family enzyme